MYSSEVENTKFWDLMRDVLFDRLDEYRDLSFYGAELAIKLCLNDNMDGCFIIDTEGAKKFIFDNWDISGDVIQDYTLDFGERLPERLDPFSNPCDDVPVIDDNWNDEFELTEKNIDEIKTQINNAHKDKFADKGIDAR